MANGLAALGAAAAEAAVRERLLLEAVAQAEGTMAMYEAAESGQLLLR